MCVVVVKSDKTKDWVIFLSWPKTLNNIHLFTNIHQAVMGQAEDYRNGWQSLHFRGGYLKTSFVQRLLTVLPTSSTEENIQLKWWRDYLQNGIKTAWTLSVDFSTWNTLAHKIKFHIYRLYQQPPNSRKNQVIWYVKESERSLKFSGIST